MRNMIVAGVVLSAVIITSAGTKTWNFEDVAVGTAPAGWMSMSGNTANGGTVTGDGAGLAQFMAAENTTIVPYATADNRIVSVDVTKTSDYNAGHHLWTDAVSFADGDIEFDILGEPAAKGNAGVSFRIQDVENFWAIRMQLTSGTSNFAWIRVKNGAAAFANFSGSAPKFVAQKWYKVKVSLAGANVKISVDGTQYVDYTDPNPVTEAGGVGLFVRGNESIINWDNLTVTSDAITSVKPVLRATQPSSSSAVLEIFNLNGRKVGVVSSKAPNGSVIFIDRDGAVENHGVSIRK